MSTTFNDPQRLQTLLDQKARFVARVDAEIASLQRSNAQQPPSSHGRPSGHRRHRPQDVPRSFSHSGSSMSRTLSTGHGQYESVPMTSTISQHSAPAMARFGSKGSASSIPSMPFSNSTGHVPPPLHENRRHTLPIETFMRHQDDPVNDYTFGNPLRQPLEQVTELDYGLAPEVYFSQIAPAVSVTLSPIEVTPTRQWQVPNPHRLSVSSQRRQSFSAQSPTTPSTAALTMATSSTEMSRETSYYSDGINGPFEMMTVRSNSSLPFDNNSFDDTPYQPVDLQSESKPFSSEEQNYFLTGAVGGNQNSHLLSSGSESTVQGASPSMSGNMKRSRSTESTSSTSSSKSRAATRLQSLIQVASIRPIAPKAENDDDSSWKKGSTTGSALKSKGGNDDRMAIPKAKAYLRPQHPRVFCTKCTEFPDGFRGAHELGRHTDRQHRGVVKKFICVEPSDGTINDEFRPVNSLVKCKACSTQKKQYGAYYNAAAHLRRAHFKPKTRGRSKSTKTEDKTEKRGGKGGGDWPPMSELKRWMKEVYVSETAQTQEDDEDCEDGCSVSGYDNQDIMFNTDISDMTTVTAAYGGGFPFNADIDTSMIDPYPQLPTTNFDAQSMPSMQFLPQNIEMSMAYASSQASFDSQPQLMNDPMNSMGSFMNDPFSQSYNLSPTDNLSFQTYDPIM